MRRFLKWLSVLALGFVAMGLYYTLTPPKHLYRFTGVFTDCPMRPSCVSSKAEDPVHAIAPLRASGSPAGIAERLAALIEADPQARVVYREDGYLHAVYVTPRMRYHDDLELLVEPDGTVQVRSISRFGYRDFGVNRARVEALRAALATP